MTYGGKGRWEPIGTLGLADAQAQIKAAFDAGVNFIDTANVYSEGNPRIWSARRSPRWGCRARTWWSQPRCACAWARRRTASGLTRAHIMNEFDASLRRLQLDHVDLYQVHGVDQITPLDETLRALEDLVVPAKCAISGCRTTRPGRS